MSFTPLLDPFHIGLAAEVMFVLCFSEPAPLTPSLAGPATIGGRAEKLSVGIMNLRSEENLATSAFASAALGTHRLKSGKKNQGADQQKSEHSGRKRTKKEEKFSAGILKNINPKKTQIQTGGFPPLSFRR
jgi:hypothetical protein